MKVTNGNNKSMNDRSLMEIKDSTCYLNKLMKSNPEQADVELEMEGEVTTTISDEEEQIRDFAVSTDNDVVVSTKLSVENKSLSDMNDESINDHVTNVSGSNKRVFFVTIYH